MQPPSPPLALSVSPISVPASASAFVRHAMAAKPTPRSVESQNLCGTPDYNSYLMLLFYFMLGAYLATPSLAINYFAKRVLCIDPASFGFLYSLVVFPWFCKPIFGLCSDQNPLFGRHRTPYLIINSFGAMLVWILLAIPGRHSRTTLGFGLLLIASNFFICFCDVVIDSMMARIARDEIYAGFEGRMQTRVWLMRHAGSLVGVVVGAFLVAHVRNLHVVFAFTAVCPAMIFIGSLMLSENVRHASDDGYAALYKAHDTQSPNMWGRLVEAFNKVRNNDTLVHLAMFIFVFAATPNGSVTFRFYLIDELRMTESFMGMLSIASVVASMLGLVAYSIITTREIQCLGNGVRNIFYMRPSTRTLTRVACVIGTVISAGPLLLVTGFNRRLGIRDEFFVFGDDVAESFSGQLAMMPVIVAIASVCPDGDEGLVYAGFMSISNIGGAVSTSIAAFLTAWLGITKSPDAPGDLSCADVYSSLINEIQEEAHKTDYTNLWILILICTVVGFVPYFFVHWLPEVSETNAKTTHVAVDLPTGPDRIGSKHRNANS
jgi:Na+/melibiose symporter-like transporter